jgi:hypothetical protein
MDNRRLYQLEKDILPRTNPYTDDERRKIRTQLVDSAYSIISGHFIERSNGKLYRHPLSLFFRVVNLMDRIFGQLPVTQWTTLLPSVIHLASHFEDMPKYRFTMQDLQEFFPGLKETTVIKNNQIIETFLQTSTLWYMSPVAWIKALRAMLHFPNKVMKLAMYMAVVSRLHPVYVRPSLIGIASVVYARSILTPRARKLNLSEWNVSKEEIDNVIHTHIRPALFQFPHASYIYDMNEDYIQEIYLPIHLSYLEELMSQSNREEAIYVLSQLEEYPKEGHRWDILSQWIQQEATPEVIRPPTPPSLIEPGTDYESMNIINLRKLAMAKGLTNVYRQKKAVLIQSLRAHDLSTSHQND